MGVNLFAKCSTNYAPPDTRTAPPNPDPKRWELLDYYLLPRAYVLVVRYLDCTNFEGVKVMVYRGEFPGTRRLQRLDPHFTPDEGSPVARFRPDEAGIAMAVDLASRL